MTLSTGQVLNNRFRIVKLLGQSDSGAVYRAWDLNANGPCALEEMPDSEAARLLLTSQSPFLLSLQHPQLPRLIDIFSLPGQGLYLAEQFVEGEDLQSVFDKAGGSLPVEKVLPWIDQVNDALGYLHSQQPPLIHGGLKPSRLRQGPDGNITLVGLSALASFDPQSQSSANPQAVTPSFSPPEQYAQSQLDARTDIYAIGAIMYMLLSGQSLPDSFLIKGKDVPPPSPVHEINPRIGLPLSKVVERATQIDPSRRFADISELKQSLSQSQAASAEPEVIPAPAPAVPPAPAPKAGKRINWVVGCVIAGVILLVLVIVAGWLAYPTVIKLLATRTPTLVPTLARTATLTPLPTSTITPTSALPAATFTPAFSPTLPALQPLLTDPSGVPMALVEAGPFMMGSDYGAADEAPMHTVDLAAFYIDQYEVTNLRYSDCVKAGVCRTPVNQSSKTHPNYYSNPEFADYPVIQVNWEMAKTYCEWRGGRLPTEAEWEKAARGADGRTFPWGDQEPDCSYANFWISGANCIGEVNEVGRYEKSVSPYNIFDMAGNVWEWVLDWFDPGYYATSLAANPLGPDKGQHRVFRGGSWTNGIGSIRTSTRGRAFPANTNNNLGMRCIRLP